MIPVWRGKENVAVVVRVLVAVSGRVGLPVHRPEETQYEHHGAQDHAAQAERLQPALTGGQERRGAPGHDQHHPDKDGPMVQGRHVVRFGYRALQSLLLRPRAAVS